MNSDPLKDKWGQEPAERRPTDDIEPTKYTELTRLKAEYLETFGEHGRDIMLDMVNSPRLHGNKMPGEPMDEYFPGDVYANAVGLYFIERTMGMKSADDAYDAMIANIDVWARTSHQFPIEEGHYPEQAWIENFTASRMIDLIGTDQPPLGTILPTATSDDKPGF